MSTYTHTHTHPPHHTARIGVRKYPFVNYWQFSPFYALSRARLCLCCGMHLYTDMHTHTHKRTFAASFTGAIAYNCCSVKYETGMMVIIELWLPVSHLTEKRVCECVNQWRTHFFLGLEFTRLKHHCLFNIVTALQHFLFKKTTTISSSI